MVLHEPLIFLRPGLRPEATAGWLYFFRRSERPGRLFASTRQTPNSPCELGRFSADNWSCPNLFIRFQPDALKIIAGWRFPAFGTSSGMRSSAPGRVHSSVATVRGCGARVRGLPARRGDAGHTAGRQCAQGRGLRVYVFTPGGGVRLAADRGRDDYVELALESAADPPQVMARISQHARLADGDRRTAAQGRRLARPDHRGRRARLLARCAGAAGWNDESSGSRCFLASACRLAGRVNRHQTAEQRNHPNIAEPSLPEQARHAMRARDNCGSIRGCNDRCRDRRAARTPSAEPTTVRYAR